LTFVPALGRRLLGALAVLSLLAAPTAAQTLTAEIPMSGLGTGFGGTFGIAYEPNTDRVYVAVSGSFGAPNSVVAVVDATTKTVLHTIPVGGFPEDVAFAYDANGNLLYGAVTNSNDGTVTVWDDQDQVVATVALPDPLGFGTCYPFGIVADDTYFWVTTVDGSGMVYAVSIATLAHDPAADLALGSGRTLARPALVGNEIWVPYAENLPGFAGSEGGLARADRTSGVLLDSWMFRRRDDFTAWPSGQDVAVLPDGRGVLAGLDFGGRLATTDAGGVLDRFVHLGLADGYGLGLHDTGDWLAVATFNHEKVLLVDLVAEEVATELIVAGLGVGNHQLPNDATFVGDEFWVTCQGSEYVLVFSGLPMPGPAPAWQGTLTVSDPTPAPGSALTLTVTGSPGETCALLYSDGTTPTLYRGQEFAIGPNPVVLAVGTGQVQRTLTVPAATGRQVFLQGYARIGGVDGLTAPKAVVVQ